MSERRRKGSPIPFEHQNGKAWDGSEISKPLPRSAPPAHAGCGMAVVDYATDETGVVTAMTLELCFYRTAEGHCRVATWHSICLPHVLPDPAQLVTDQNRVQRLLAQVERDDAK